MRITGSHIVAAMLVVLLTVLAPDGATTASVTDPLGAQAGTAEAAEGAFAPVPGIGARATEVQVSATAGTVAVRVTVIDPNAPAPTVIPVYRFYSAKSGTHFYTPSAEERDMVIARWSNVWAFEGVAYTVNPARNTHPLYRFYNRANGSHFYTPSVAERDMVFAKWMNVFSYDGPTYSVTPGPEAGKSPVWRFFNMKNGSHFYTASAQEADHVIATWPNIYRLEGIAFWLGQ